MKKIIYIISAFLVLCIGYSISVTPSYKPLDITHAIEKARTELKENQEIMDSPDAQMAKKESALFKHQGI